jgi:hypothetical protein
VEFEQPVRTAASVAREQREREVPRFMGLVSGSPRRGGGGS